MFCGIFKKLCCTIYLNPQKALLHCSSMGWETIAIIYCTLIYACTCTCHVDVRGRSVRWDLGVDGEEEEEEIGDVVRSKVVWDSQKKTAQLFDLENPVDTRRCVVYVCVCVNHGHGI